MNTLKTLLVLLTVTLAPALMATDISSDITTNTTWDNAGSPYVLKKDIKVHRGATLTIDSSSGNVEIQLGTLGLIGVGSYDLQIGGGVRDDGFLHLKAASGTIKFRMFQNSNLIVNAYGQVKTTDSTAVTYFQNFGSTGTLDDWGAIDFEASQQYQSQLINFDISGGGFDGKDGALVVRDTETNTPLLEDLTFDSCNVSAIRFDGKGINTLRQDGLKGPLGVTDTDYVFWLNAVTSTVSIRFPDPDTPSAPEVKLSSTCTVGNSSNVSHWRFDDAYTFKCAASSKVNIVRGTVWGTEETRPTFESISGSPSYSDWVGFADTHAHGNNFGGLSAVSFLNIRDATNGVHFSRTWNGFGYIGFAGHSRIAGIDVKHCQLGIGIASSFETLTIDGCVVGGTVADDKCNDHGIHITEGEVRVIRCNILGVDSGDGTAYGVHASSRGAFGGTPATSTNVTITECRITGDHKYGVYATTSGGTFDIALRRTQIASELSTATAVYLASAWQFSPTAYGTLICGIEHTFVQGGTHGLYSDCTNANSTLLLEVTNSMFTASGAYAYYANRSGDSSSTADFTRCSFVDTTNGAYLASNSTNTCEYTFTECLFSGNSYGIRDARTQTARAVVTHSSFVDNTTYGAFDDSGGAATTDLLAENCYWDDPDGPTIPMGTPEGDEVNANVDYDPFLARSYIGYLIGGSPASASEWDVWEDTSNNANNLHVIDDTPFFKWTFASDFEGDTQSAYEIEVDDSIAFDSKAWDSGKLSSTSLDKKEYAGSPLGSSIYYARIRLWNDEDLPGPWRYLTFRLNSAPAKVGNVDRTPVDDAPGPGIDPLGDWTPVLQWTCPSDGEENPLHFEVEVEDGTTTYTVRSWKLSVDSGGSQVDARVNFEISTDDGGTWQAMPEDGAPVGEALLVRLTWPNTYALADQSDPDFWDWRVRAWDGFEYGTYSDVWNFEIDRGYTISGRLLDNGGATAIGLDSKTIRLYVNGEDTGDTEDTSTINVVSGRFDLTTTYALKAGDVLWLYVDGETEKGAAVLHFPGDDITYDADAEDIVIRDERLYVYGTVSGLAFGNDDFDIVDPDTDIPWTYSSGEVEFSTNIEGTDDGVHLAGRWDLTANVNEAMTTNDVELVVEVSGHLRTLGHDVWFHRFDNGGRLEVTGGSDFQITGAGCVSSQNLHVQDATLTLDGGGAAVTVTIDAGIAEFRNSTVDDPANLGGVIKIDSASLSSDLAHLICIGTSFQSVGVVVETDGVVDAFNDNEFDGTVTDRHIHWKSTQSLNAAQMRNIQFNVSFGPGQYNVEATSAATNINMIGCGGVGHGEDDDNDSGDKVDWELVPTTGLQVISGDGRLRLEWDASEHTDISNTGYNMYRSTTETGTYAKINGSTVTDTYYHDSSLSNGTAYWYYVTVLDENPAPDEESGPSNKATGTPKAAAITAISPGETQADSVLALSIIGDGTHWDDASTTVAIEQNDGGGSSGVTVNDKLVISPYLILVDATLLSASAEVWDVDVTELDVWGLYDEVATGSLTVSANDADLDGRPTLVFSTNNFGIAADATPSGSSSFVVNIDFTDNTGGIDTTKFEMHASRDFEAYFGGVLNTVAAGSELVSSGVVIETLNDSRATWTIEQLVTANGEEDFEDGEYTLKARVADDNGNYSEWASLRFYVNGGTTDVVTVDDDGSDPVYLLQGATMDVDLSGTGLSSTVTDIDFGANITVNSATGSGSSITVNVTVDETAVCGPRTFTTNGGSKTGIAIVEYPTNILPTTTNAEPSRNPAIGGVNVFLTNGAFFKSETDIATRGRMMGMSWSRFYRSDITYNGPLGHGWVGHYFQRAVIDGNSDINWYTPDGRKEVFPDVTGGYANPVGVYVTATSESTFETITLTDRHGYQCVFNADGRLWRCIDRNGNATECSYNYVGQLTTITDDRGKTWDIAYGSDGRVSSVTDNVWDDTTPRVVEYDYDTDGDLVEQKAPETDRYDDTGSNRTTYGYRYDDEHKLTACINPREFNEGSEPVAYMENFYDSSDRVIDQRLGSEADVLDGHITKSSFIRLRYESATLIRELDRNGHRTEYTIDASGRATTVKRFTGFYSVDTDEPITHSTVTSVLSKLRSSDPTSFDTTFTYNSNHEILTILYPRGNKVAYDYPNGTSQTSGTATSAPTATVLTDSGKSWTADAYIGMTLRMGSDAGEYAYYPITDNDATTITIESVGYSLSGDGWLNGEDYAVYDENGDPMGAGNVLEVRRSDEGLGSLSDIVTTYTYEPRYQFVKTVTDPRSETTTYTYDYEESAANGADTGNLLFVTSPDIDAGQTSTQTIITRTTYNEYGQPVTMTDGEGNVTYFEYYPDSDLQNRGGFLKLRTSAYGELNLKSEYDYDDVGNLTASWSPRAFESGATKDDFKTAYEVNELNQTWHVTSKYEVGDPTSSTLASVDSYRYFDLNGNLAQSFREYVTDGNTGGTGPSNPDDPTTFTKATTAMAGTWVETSYTYNLLNYAATRTVDAIAGSAITQYTTRTEYDSNYNVLASITPLGNRTHTVYDERDLVYQRIAGAESDVMGTYETDYDANGNVSKSRDALGNETFFVYDGFDRTTKVTDPAGHYRETDYDANSNVTETRAYDFFETLLTRSQTTYDEINRAYVSKRLAEDHNGHSIGDGWATSTTVFDKNSRVVTSTNDNGVTYTTFYDGANRVDYTRDAVGNEVHYTYNAHSATTKIDYLEVNGLNGVFEKSHVEHILNRSDVAWESRDRRWSTSFDTSGHTKRDGWGRVTERVDADDSTNKTTYNYDLLSRTTDTTEEAGTDDINTQFTYDDDSRTIQRAIKRNPGASTYQETEYEYDERNRLITQRRPDGDIWEFFYDENSNQTGWLDPLGTGVTDVYDERNLLSYRDIDRGENIKGPTSESYEFDGLARLVSCSNYDGSDLISASQWEYNTLSLIEYQAQTIANMTPLDTYSDQKTFEVTAEFDASGFCKGVTNWNGRRVERYRDDLDRLLEVYDYTHNTSVGVFIYAGPSRLVQRVNGNGTRLDLQYESSGCGCGGATGFIEAVDHNNSGGNPLFSVDRRYDVRGLVTAERRNHWGGKGRVYRYDDANRLIDSYYGVDLYDTTGVDDLAGFADPSTTPTTFGLNADYDLDPRGNRSGSTGVSHISDGSTTVKDFAYTVDANTNIYTTVDGDTSTFDAMEQQMLNKSTGMTTRYDYKGQKTQIVDASGESDEIYTTFDYDNQGRLLLESEEVPDMAPAPETERANQTAFVNSPGCDCGCNGGGGDDKLAMIRIDNDGTVTSNAMQDYGPDPMGSGSAICWNPATGGKPSNDINLSGGIFHEHVEIYEQPDVSRYHHRDHLGSLIGMTNGIGVQIAEYDYLDYGEPIYMQIDGVMSSVTSSHDSGNDTTLLSGASSANWEGKEVRIALRDGPSPHYISAEILQSGASGTLLYDPTGDVDDAITNAHPTVGGGVIVYDNPNGTQGGVWDDLDYNGVSTWFVDDEFTFSSDYIGLDIQLDITSTTTHSILDYEAIGNKLLVTGDLTGSISIGDAYRIQKPNSSGAAEEANSGIWDTVAFAGGNTTFTAPPIMEFRDFQVGWILIPNVATPSHVRIGSISGNTITVSGDLTDLASAGDRFRIIAPVGAEQDTGEAALDVWKDSSRYLWSGYMYEPPLLGYEQSSTTYRRAPGPDNDAGTYDDNRSGSYYCWNRTYDPSTGRWTTPDPAASPWSNLQDYVGSNPVSGTDPAGLKPPGQNRRLPGYSGRDRQPHLSKDTPSSFKVDCGTLRWENTKREWGSRSFFFLGDPRARYGFKVTFEPNGNCCCSAIHFVQFARLWTDKKINTELPAEAAEHNDSMVFDDEGWFVDTGDKTPYYGGSEPGFVDGVSGQSQNAVLEDAPGTNLRGGLFTTYDKMTYEFVTCAVCPEKRKLYGCVKFSIKFTYSSKHGVKPSLSRKPFLRTQSSSWWNNDKTVKAWNEAFGDSEDHVSLFKARP